jgi:hypothetical protein
MKKYEVSTRVSRDDNSKVLARVGGMVTAMVKVNIRSRVFANDTHITPRGLLSLC